MYYYLKELKGYPIQVVGLDLKKDVIALCNRLSEKFGFENLIFTMAILPVMKASLMWIWW